MKEPVDHILRPTLPWRSPNEPVITECGYNGESVKTLSREEFSARLKEMGEQRAALFTCMTCSQTARRHSTWDEDPRRALQREIEWESGWRRKNGRRLLDELLAIQKLIELYPLEFQRLVQREQWRSKKPATEARH